MASADWYTVFYTEGQGVAGRLNGAAQNLFALVKAPSASNARNKVSSMKGSSAVIGNVDGPYATRDQAQKEAKSVLGKIDKASQAGKLPDLNPFNWLGSLGGMIASGLESGFLNLITDIWNVIVGPLEVMIGAVIAGFVITVYFKDDIMSAARVLAMAA